MIKVDLDMFVSTKILTRATWNAELQVNSVSGVKKILEDLKWYLRKDERWKV